jgi:hypothetical protein
VIRSNLESCEQRELSRAIVPPGSVLSTTRGSLERLLVPDLKQLGVVPVDASPIQHHDRSLQLPGRVSLLAGGSCWGG